MAGIFPRRPPRTVPAMVEQPPRKSTAREVTEKALEAAVGMVPVVGSPIAVAMATAMGWAYNRRVQRWLEDLATAVSELQEWAGEPWTFEELAGNDAFVDAVVQATRAAQATHRNDQLDALRNGVLHTLLPDAPSLDEQARFFRLVEQFGPGHLQLLQVLDDAGEFFDRRQIPRPDIYMGGRIAIVRAAMRGTGDDEWWNLLDGDLRDAGLTNHGGLNTTMTGSGMYQSVTTPLGKRFLRFVSAPKRPADD